ncbi:AAA family ATPase [Kitasatospora azatica]|uniref:AAA family ATPase n=1 Tax=Kitasatospora azatica TaxID=58347 RepID=UPI00068BE6E3|nr:AAA family ATPase [Kitasatospora azatica]
MIIGIEGVSCAGKTALAAALAPQLNSPVVIPCYYHVAPDPQSLPAPRVRTARQQLASLAVFLEIEQLRLDRARQAQAAGRDVILDRTVDTLLAHAHAIGRMEGFDCDERARTMVLRHEVAMPDLTLVLTTDPAVLATRATSRPGMPPIFYDPQFSEHFNTYLKQSLAARTATLDTSACPVSELTDQALAHIRQHRAPVRPPYPAATGRGDLRQVAS